jgi:hypothetical protein
MKRTTVLLIPVLCLALTALVLADSIPNYSLSWWTADGGGTMPNDNSGYTLGGTVGQPDAAVWSGNDYVLAGGFWGGVAVEYRIYLPLVLRGT